VDTFTPTPTQLFFTKNDPDDIRLGEIFKSIQSSDSIPENSYAISGYPDDEGIRLNGGRIGAAAGPSSIRQFLYKMTPLSTDCSFYDIGDLTTAPDLKTRHQIAQQNIFELQSRGINTISFGGGHDYGYPDASGFLKAFIHKKQRPVVLNFDAHLDVRPTTNGLTSGTPFFRLLNEFEGQFDFAEIGIQPQCNSLLHREWALQKKSHIFDLKDLQNNEGLVGLLQHSFFKSIQPETPVFISFDIDSLTSTEAPGCSQSWVTGLKTQNYLDFFRKFSKTCKVKGLGLYEVSPSLDFAGQTSKTAALIAYNYLFQDLI
jgi:formiminoglutamase